MLGCPCPTAHHTALLLMLHWSWPLGTAPMSCEVRVRSGTEQDEGLMAPFPHSQHAFDLCEWLSVNGPRHLAWTTLPGPICGFVERLAGWMFRADSHSPGLVLEYRDQHVPSKTPPVRPGTASGTNMSMNCNSHSRVQRAGLSFL